MRRLFCADIGAVGTVALLDSLSQRHARVLRLSEGMEVMLFDGQGTTARARLEAANATVLNRVRAPDPQRRIVLVLGLPRGPAVDSVIRMGTELGVHAFRIAPVQHSQSKRQDADKRIVRWRTLAREATRQSERLQQPHVTVLPDLEAALEGSEGHARCVGWARGGAPIGSLRPSDEQWIAIGPEGGFADPELARFDVLGWKRVSLAEHVLRVDTAAVAAISALTRPHDG